MQADGAKKLSFGAALLAALAASSCCLVPLVLTALGLGGAAATAVLGAFRPYLFGAAGVLLAAGFYFAYRKPKACGCARPGMKGRWTWWLASALVLVAALAPSRIARWAAMGPPGAAPPDLVQEIITVRGLDCEACAAPISTALSKVGGFYDLHLDLAAGTATVRYQPAAARLQAYVAAINELGYEAAMPSGSESKR
ncbi:cation transporter [Pendulispora brunnea]|uniref:Mercuric transport protein MerT n=1 Tax=Pendulispora brunnea TaxID=2905690 RepID=A0ABZ2K617_9BACT